MDLKKLTAQAEKLRQMTATSKSGTGRRWYDIKNQGATTQVYVYDMIGEWGVTAQDFVNELNAIGTPAIDLHINSEGGQVFDGIAIYNAIRNHPAKVTAYVDSLAASAASFIVQGADERVMEPNARMMIHDAQGVVMGDASAARALADLLDDTSENIASIYAERSGVEAADWRAAMQKDGGAGTWYGAQDAKDAGLIDRIAGEDVQNPGKPYTEEEKKRFRKTNNQLEVVPEAVPAEAPSWDFDLLSAVKEALK